MTVPRDDLFEQAPCGYVVLDSSGVILTANREFLRLVDRSRDEVEDIMPLPDLVSVGGRIFFDTHVFPILHVEGSVREIALDLVRADGTRVPVLLNADLIRTDNDPGQIRIRAILLEVRDRRRYEEDLLHSTHLAEEAQRRATELAQTLQQTLIPPVPPRIEGLLVSAAYRPAGDGSEVGGDFYDVFQVAEDEWVLVIGDVRGKGVEAALVTAFVRHAVRELAMQVRDPSELLRQLDTALAGHETERFCTLVVTKLRRRGDGWTLRGSVGGHPLPILRRPDGVTAEVGQPGSLVGIVDDPRFATFELALADGLLLFYTDGVVEARREGELYGEDRLRSVVAEGPADVEQLTRTIVESVLAFQQEDAQDDIAILAVQRRPV